MKDGSDILGRGAVVDKFALISNLDWDRVSRRRRQSPDMPSSLIDNKLFDPSLLIQRICCFYQSFLFLARLKKLLFANLTKRSSSRMYASCHVT